MEATRNMTTSPLVRRWCAVSMVGAVASRKVWTTTYRGKKLHANQFVMLVGKPGTGKTDPIEFVEECLDGFELSGDEGHVVFAPNITTPAAWLQDLGQTFSESKEAADAEERRFTSQFTVISEWSAFTMDQECDQFYSALADLWEWKQDKPFRKSTKEHGKDAMYNPYVGILAGVQPEWFVNGMPKGGFKKGFSARMLWVNVHGGGELELFTAAPEREKAELVAGLQRVRQAEGEVRWAPEAAEALKQWVKAGCPPRPSDPLLSDYCVRRHMHLGKTALCSALARGSQRIELLDLERAKQWLLELEAEMPEAIMLAGENPLVGVSELAVTYVRELQLARNGPVAETDLRRHIAKMVKPQDVGLLLGELVNQGRLVVVKGGDAGAPHRWFVVGKQEEAVAAVEEAQS